MIIVYAAARIFFVIVRNTFEITMKVNWIGGEAGAVGMIPNLTLKCIAPVSGVCLSDNTYCGHFREVQQHVRFVLICCSMDPNM